MFDKIWQRHAILEREDGQSLLAIDRHYVHEGSFHAFEALANGGRKLARPRQTFAFADHYVPTRGRPAPSADPEIRNMVELLDQHVREHELVGFLLGDQRQGIVHVVAPEQGLTLPGLVIVCGDSHTATHGAFGALAFGIGASEVAHVLATQTLWQRRPKTMRVRIDGALGFGVGPKDVILALIAAIGADGGVGHVIEYAGSTIEGMTMEGRMTVCNMSIEAGARAGLVAPDAVTLGHLAGRPYAPKRSEWDRAVAQWQALRSDAGASFDREVRLDAASLAPTVTWGTSPQDAAPITAHVPDPAALADAEKRLAMRRSLDYMALAPGQPLDGIAVDQVFIGSCTNGRIEDLRAAAGVLAGRRVAVPTMLVPGSGQVKVQAEAEGLARQFVAAGAEWRDPACSMCVGTNGDLLSAGQRCASTSNRNFEGRQGRGVRTHLMSPAMAAAAAATGRLTDVRKLGG